MSLGASQTVGSDIIRTEDWIADVSRMLASAESPNFERIGLTYGELIKQKFPPREEVIFGLGRGEVGILNSVNNAGKTTLLRNLMISLCTGKVFQPFGDFSAAKRVAFLDFEDTWGFLRQDLGTMLAALKEQERSHFNDNALLICEQKCGDDEDLSLSNFEHLSSVTASLTRFDPDLIIVDTIGSAFEIQNENDNAEVRSYVMRPLKHLARNVNAALLATHHMGKPKAEEGQVREASFRGRGASSFADMGRLILNLEKGVAGETTTLRCAKVKGTRFPDMKLKLNTHTRWFESVDSGNVPSNYETVLSLFVNGHEYKTAEILKVVAGEIPERSLKRVLKLAVEIGDLQQLKRGVYQKRGSDSQRPGESAKVPNI